MITTFNELFEVLRARSKKRMIAAWGVDDHTITAASKAIEKGIVERDRFNQVRIIMEDFM